MTSKVGSWCGAVEEDHQPERGEKKQVEAKVSEGQVWTLTASNCDRGRWFDPLNWSEAAEQRQRLHLLPRRAFASNVVQWRWKINSTERPLFLSFNIPLPFHRRYLLNIRFLGGWMTIGWTLNSPTPCVPPLLLPRLPRASSLGPGISSISNCENRFTSWFADPVLPTSVSGQLSPHPRLRWPY